MTSHAEMTPDGAVTVYSRRRASAGLLVRDPRLDADGKTLSVLGAKSAIAGRAVGERIVVRMPDGGLVTGTITHIHRTSDRYRAAVSVAAVLRVGGRLPPAVRTAAPEGELMWLGRGRATRESP